MENKTLGQKIEYYRKRAKMSQLDLEIAIGAGQGSISRIENDQVNPTKETLRKLIEILNLDKVEAGNLYGIEVTRDYKPLLNSSFELFKSMKLEDVLQATVDNIVRELGLFSCFITLLDGDKLYAQTSTNNWTTKLTTKILGRDIKGLNVDITKDFENLMVKAVIHNKSFESSDLHKFLYPAVDLKVAKLIEKLVGPTFCIALPISYNNMLLGAIMFGKKNEKSFDNEREILIEFTRWVGLAVTKARGDI